MRQEELVTKVQTVLGLVDPDQLGITLPHEHLLANLADVYFVESDEPDEKRVAHEPVRMENLYRMKTHCVGNVDNQMLTNEELAIEEAEIFKAAGGDTIVELTSIGLARDPLGLARISRATGLNIVMGSGYYVAPSHPPEIATMSGKEIADGIEHDILESVDGTRIRSGIIGEIGCSTPMTENEAKILRACATAQRATGAAISVHPGFSDDSLLEIASTLDEAGADLGRTVIGHVDVFSYSPEVLRRLASAGCYLEYDTFGYPATPATFQGSYLDLSSDAQRINDIIQLIEEGYMNQILVSQDHCFKHLLVTYGGYGYAHILRDLVPVMLSKGLSQEQINTIMVDNPKRLLTFVPARH
jgi:phosphotriesterase-related protein